MSKDKTKGEFTGGDVNYYVVEIREPKRMRPYAAEAEDIIEALGMTFAEGCAFKAIWRSCAARALGVRKEGMDEHGIYDAEKVVYYGGRMLAQRKKAAA
jgi:chemotaxis response regulator CheB